MIDKEADKSTVRAGGLAGYTITARNRGRRSDRNVQVCDRIPRRTRFVSANRKLRRIGRRRCLVIPRLRPGQRESFHLTVRVNPNAAPGTLANIADITPGVEPPGSGTRPMTESPNLPAAPGGRLQGRPALGAQVRAGRAKATREGPEARSTERYRISERHPPPPALAAYTGAPPARVDAGPDAKSCKAR